MARRFTLRIVDRPAACRPFGFHGDRRQRGRTVTGATPGASFLYKNSSVDVLSLDEFWTISPAGACQPIFGRSEIGQRSSFMFDLRRQEGGLVPPELRPAPAGPLRWPRKLKTPPVPREPIR